MERRAKETFVDLNEAIQKHAQWKFRFHQALLNNEPMDAGVIAKDNQCELGKWLYGEARALHGQRKAHAQCLARHTAFHAEAGKVAGTINAKRKDEAERMLANGSPFSEASKAVAVALIELQNEIGR
jgi:methyl-accepting chemotaxis protein